MGFWRSWRVCETAVNLEFAIKKFYFLLVALSIIAVPCAARLFSSFNGLDKMIDNSDAIVIARIEQTTSRINLNGWEMRKCYIYQSLKRGIAVNQRIVLRLADSNNVHFPSGIKDGNSYILFLNKIGRSGGAPYASLSQEGDHIEVSPLGNEKKPEGKTTKEQIQTLIRRYIAYRDERLKKENVLLNKMLQ